MAVHRDQSAREYTSQVIKNLIKAADNLSVPAIKLFLQKFEGFNEKLIVEKPVPYQESEEDNEEVKQALQNMGFTLIEKKAA